FYFVQEGVVPDTLKQRKDWRGVVLTLEDFNEAKGYLETLLAKVDAKAERLSGELLQAQQQVSELTAQLARLGKETADPQKSDALIYRWIRERGWFHHRAAEVHGLPHTCSIEDIETRILEMMGKGSIP
ncbi:hypothetical protein, partial [Pseudomonas sp. MAG002Y]